MKRIVSDSDLQIYHGDCLEVLRSLGENEADACVTSPPYLNARPEYPSPTQDEFTEIFRELRRVVRGPLILNVGRLWSKKKENLWWVLLLDSCSVAGWDLRDTMIWVKKNANPLRGQVLVDSHEYVFLLGDGFNVDEIRTPYTDEAVARMGRKWENGARVKGVHKTQDGRKLNPLGARPRSFFATNIGREKGNPHPAPMAMDIANHLVKLATTAGGTVLDPFGGSGNTALAARSQGKKSILIEISEEYANLSAERLSQQAISIS